MNHKRLFAILCIFTLCLTIGCKKKQVEPEVTTTVETTTTAAPIPIIRSVTSGREVSAIGFPIAVSIPNDPSARPQKFIGSADVVYEMYAEGDITRMLAIFADQKPVQVGPIRSGRIYMVDIISDWGGGFVHFGGSSGGAFDLDKKLKENPPAYNLDGIVDTTYIKRDKSRRAPNNAFVNLESYTQQVVSKQPPIAGPLVFRELDALPMVTGTPVNEITIPYSSSNKVRYVFQDGVYKRFIGNKPFIDGDSTAQVEANNVIVQQVKQKNFKDKSGHIDLQMIGSGPAVFYMNGQKIVGSWEKTSEKVSTKFKDASGVEIKFEPGKTWVQVITEKIKTSEI